MKHVRTELFESEWVLPAGRLARTGRKLMIVLHGRGDSLRAFRSIRREMRIPGMTYLLLNAPRKFSGGFSWYALEPRHERGIRAVRAKLMALIEQLKAAGWKTQDMFFLGHSQGCLVACDLVMNHPESFGGVVGVSGYMWFSRNWKRGLDRSGARRTPWLITHGTRDRIIVPDEIRGDVEQLVSGRVPVLYQEFKKGHDFDFQEEVPFIRDWIRRPRRSRMALGVRRAAAIHAPLR